VPFAFRVDVKDQTAVVDFEEADRYVLSAMTVLPTGHVYPQVRVGLDYGWRANFIALSYFRHTHQTMLVRLYRRGYRTIEAESWDVAPELTWQPAVGREEQEKAVDALFSTWKTDERSQLMHSLHAADPPRSAELFCRLAPGSTSTEHHNALRFAAVEYERLAIEPDADEGQRNRLLAKAGALRNRASE
jgi:hypothetical protein